MTQTKPSRIPDFKTLQEEALFWDTHDFTDYLDELKPTKVRFRKNLEHVLSVRLDDKTLTALEEHASKKGVGATTLIRMWVLEQLQQPTSSTV